MLFHAAIDGDGRRITAGDVRAALPRKADVAKPLAERILALVAGAGMVTTGSVTSACCVDRVTAWRALDRLVEGGKLVAEGEIRSRIHRLPEVVVEERDPELGVVLALVREHGRVTKRMVMKRLGTADRTTSRLLSELCGARLLLVDASGPATRYASRPAKRA